METTVTLALDAPPYTFSTGDRATFGTQILGTDALFTEALGRIRVSIRILRELVQAKYSRMDAKDGRLWGPILDQVAEEPARITVTGAQWEWLYRLVTNDDLQIDSSLAHWRVTLETYVQQERERLRAGEARAQ